MKKNTKTLLQIILMIFVMNVSMSYSASCTAISASDDAPAAAFPCHQSETTEQESPGFDGCSLCAQIILALHEETIKPATRILIEFTMPAALPRRFSPPYRPPILLS
jgi:hypothetical protein